MDNGDISVLVMNIAGDQRSQKLLSSTVRTRPTLRCAIKNKPDLMIGLEGWMPGLVEEGVPGRDKDRSHMRLIGDKMGNMVDDTSLFSLLTAESASYDPKGLYYSFAGPYNANFHSPVGLFFVKKSIVGNDSSRIYNYTQVITVDESSVKLNGHLDTSNHDGRWFRCYVVQLLGKKVVISPYHLPVNNKGRGHGTKYGVPSLIRAMLEQCMIDIQKHNFQHGSEDDEIILIAAGDPNTFVDHPPSSDFAQMIEPVRRLYTFKTTEASRKHGNMVLFSHDDKFKEQGQNKKGMGEDLCQYYTETYKKDYINSGMPPSSWPEFRSTRNSEMISLFCKSFKMENGQYVSMKNQVDSYDIHVLMAIDDKTLSKEDLFEHSTFINILLGTVSDVKNGTGSSKLMASAEFLDELQIEDLKDIVKRIIHLTGSDVRAAEFIRYTLETYRSTYVDPYLARCTTESERMLLSEYRSNENIPFYEKVYDSDDVPRYEANKTYVDITGCNQGEAKSLLATTDHAINFYKIKTLEQRAVAYPDPTVPRTRSDAWSSIPKPSNFQDPMPENSVLFINPIEAKDTVRLASLAGKNTDMTNPNTSGFARAIRLLRAN